MWVAYIQMSCYEKENQLFMCLGFCEMDSLLLLTGFNWLFWGKHKQILFVLEFLAISHSPQPLLRDCVPFIALIPQVSNEMMYSAWSFSSWSWGASRRPASELQPEVCHGKWELEGLESSFKANELINERMSQWAQRDELRVIERTWDWVV